MAADVGGVAEGADFITAPPPDDVTARIRSCLGCAVVTAIGVCTALMGCFIVAVVAFVVATGEVVK